MITLALEILGVWVLLGVLTVAGYNAVKIAAIGRNR